MLTGSFEVFAKGSPKTMVATRDFTKGVVFISQFCYRDSPSPAGRYWETVERLKMNQFYGAPTALRLLMKSSDDFVKKYDRFNLH